MFCTFCERQLPASSFRKMHQGGHRRICRTCATDENRRRYQQQVLADRYPGALLLERVMMAWRKHDVR